MEVNLNNVAVIHNEEARRFELPVEGLRALLTYRRFPDRIVFDHTEVPQPLEGKGLAAKLARAALDFARANQLRVVPLCPFARTWLERHPDAAGRVTIEWSPQG